MPIIEKSDVIKILSQIKKQECIGACKTTWIRNIKNALKSKTNPLGLSAKEKKTLTKKIKDVSGKKSKQTTQKKYKNRMSPPYKANAYCGKSMMGNDGEWYASIPNINNVCTWRKAKD